MAEIPEEFMDMARGVVERWSASVWEPNVDSHDIKSLTKMFALQLQSSVGNDPNWTGKVVYHCVEEIAAAVAEVSDGKYTVTAEGGKVGANGPHHARVETTILVMR